MIGVDVVVKLEPTAVDVRRGDEPRRLIRWAESQRTKAPLVLLAVILALGLALRIVFWYGLVNVDPYAYADSAAAIARWQPVFDPGFVGSLYYTQYIRLTLTVPAAFFYRLFGPGDVVSTIAPIAASLGIGVVAFALARRAADNRAGLIAAFLAVVFPLNVMNSTQFLPDTMMAFFAGLTMLLFLKAWEDERTRGQRVLLYFGAGAAWALAFYARPTAVALALPFIALVVLRRRLHPEMAAGVVGAFLVVGMAQILLLSLGGSLFEDIRTVFLEGRSAEPGALSYGDIDWTYARDLVRRPDFLPTVLLAGAGLGLAIAARGWRGFWASPALAILVLAVGQYVYFEFLMRLPGLYSWWKEPRYVLSMLVPMFALAGIGLSQWLSLLGPRLRRTAGFYVIGGLLFVFAASLHTLRNDHAYWQEHRIDGVAREVAAFLETQPEAPVFTWNDDFARYLSVRVGLDRTSVYERRRNEGLIRNRFNAEGFSLVEPGSFVVIGEGLESPGLTTAPAAHWQEVWAIPGMLTIYRVPAPVISAEVVAAGFGVAGEGGGLPVAFARGHLLVEFRFTEPLQSDTVVSVFTVCPAGGAGPEVLRVLPAGSRSVRVDVPLNAPGDGQECSVVARAALPAVDWEAEFPVRVPVARVVEPEGDFSHDRALEASRGSGWVRVDQPFYSAGAAVVAVQPWMPLRPELERIPAGDYRVTLSVYDYGAGENSVLFQLNGIEHEVRWGGSGEGAGVTTIFFGLENVAAGGHMFITPLTQGQDGIVIDRVVLVGR